MRLSTLSAGARPSPRHGAPPSHAPPGPRPPPLRSQPDSSKRSHNGFGFGSEPRLNVTSNATTSASLPSARLVDTSNHAKSPRAHFGTSTRAHSNMVYSVFTFKPQ